MTDAIICDVSAIPADQRDAHFALARSLLFADERAVREVESGLTFDVPRNGSPTSPDSSRTSGAVAGISRSHSRSRHATAP